MSEEGGSRLGSFLLGGIVGGVAGLVAGRLGARQQPRRPPTPPGLAAFEEAPCFQELLDQDARSRPGGSENRDSTSRPGRR